MLNHRIQCIADMVKKGMIVADIGTDHAQLPIYLLKHHYCLKAYACDITIGPLMQAKKNIKKYGLENLISIIQSDGLSQVPYDANCIIIAGMGYYTIQEIMQRDITRIRTVQQLLIQSNTDLYELRKWMAEIGFSIRNEELIYDKKHFYVVMDIDVSQTQVYQEIDFLCGPVLRKKITPLFQQYVSEQVYRTNKLLQHITDCDKIKKLEQELLLWSSVLREDEGRKKA